MRFVSILTAVALSTAVAAPAIAQDAGITRGALVTSSDGKRLAKIDRINNGADGQPASVSVLFDGAFVYLPYSSLKAEGGKVATSLSKAEVRKLRNR